MSELDDLQTSPEASKSQPGVREIFFAVGLTTLAIYALNAAANYLVPIVLAVLIWFLINAIAHGLRSLPGLKWVLPKGVALIFGTLITLGVVYLAGQIVVSNVAELTTGFEHFSTRAAELVGTVEKTVGISFHVDVKSTLDNLKVSDYLELIVTPISSTANTTLLTLMYVLFLLMDQPFYGAKIRALFPDPERQSRIRVLLDRIGRNTRAYVWIMTVVSVGVGLFTYAIARYFELPGAAFWGFLAFALNYIPTIGSFLGVLFPAAYALVQFENVESIFAFIVALGVVQFVMGNILLPRMTGNRLNLSQFVVILSLTVWGAIWGVAGLFLAVPIMMVLAIVLSQLDSTRPLAILLSQTGKVGDEE
ncbi:MAG: AI-2E family transporter [Neomegalonema sp.]|nr:AI-2E family transporter [Neomegalonema sp.]